MAQREKTVLIKRKQYLARQIRNIKEDYSGVDQEDMPEDVAQELKTLYAEMHETQTKYEALIG